MIELRLLGMVDLRATGADGRTDAIRFARAKRRNDASARADLSGGRSPRRRVRPSAWLNLLAVAVTTAGCRELLVTEPAPSFVDIAPSFTVVATADTAGLAEAYAASDTLHVAVLRGSVTVLDTLPLSLQVDTATGTDGWTCNIAGQLVSCTDAGGGSLLRTTRPRFSISVSRWVSTLALIPGRSDFSSEKRRDPKASSRRISIAQRSPINSSACATPQASSYRRLVSDFPTFSFFF